MVRECVTPAIWNVRLGFSLACDEFFICMFFEQLWYFVSPYPTFSFINLPCFSFDSLLLFKKLSAAAAFFAKAQRYFLLSLGFSFQPLSSSNDWPLSPHDSMKLFRFFSSEVVCGCVCVCVHAKSLSCGLTLWSYGL